MPKSRQPASTPGYLLPEDAHHRLRRLYEHLHLLTQLTQAASPHDDPIIPPAAWTGCLQHLTEQLEQALATARWQPH